MKSYSFPRTGATQVTLLARHFLPVPVRPGQARVDRREARTRGSGSARGSVRPFMRLPSSVNRCAKNKYHAVFVFFLDNLTHSKTPVGYVFI